MKDLLESLLVQVPPASQTKSILCAEVAVPLPLENTYTYLVPEEFQKNIGRLHLDLEPP